MAVRYARRAPLTYAHLLHLREKLDERSRYEIIDGELYVTPSPRTDHQDVSGRLYLQLGSYVQEHGLGMVFYAPLDVILSDLDVVEPDLIYLTAEQYARAGERWITEAPTLIVEILSPSTSRRDRTIKRALYERAGVPHYWMLDTARRRLDAYVLVEGRYELATTAVGDAEFRPSLFPGLVLRLASIWPPRSRAARPQR